MFLPGLAVVFVGIIGNSPKTVDLQVKVMLRDDANVAPASLAAAAVAKLTHHADGSAQIVKRMHVDGVVGGELIASQGHRTLRVVIYDGAGSLKSLSEVPISGRVLSNDELEVLRSNIEDEVITLGGGKHGEDIQLDEPVPAKAAPPIAKVEPPKPTPKIAEPKPFVVVKPIAAASTRPSKAATTALGFVPDESHDSDFIADAPAKHEARAREAAPVETADASESVSATDIEAMMTGDETGGGGGDVHASASTDAELHIRAGAGIGLASRSFTPGPSTVPGYSSSPVATIHLEAGVMPTTRASLGVIAERTLQMGTPLHGGMTNTTMSRWEATAGYTLVRSIALAPQLGVGRRSFGMDSTDPSRSPDSDYNYLILGARASVGLGSRIALHGVAAFEPVVSGNEPTAMAFGHASRWAFDLGASVDVRLLTHVFARVSADFQQFSWSWDQAGTRGAGGAVDGYPSGALSLGAEY
jgi:hypothetical protein